MTASMSCCSLVSGVATSRDCNGGTMQLLSRGCLTINIINTLQDNSPCAEERFSTSRKRSTTRSPAVTDRQKNKQKGYPGCLSHSTEERGAQFFLRLQKLEGLSVSLKFTQKGIIRNGLLRSTMDDCTYLPTFLSGNKKDKARLNPSLIR